jgi:NADH:ubiquinone oxidoreductase subunit 6 (subunit J)
VGERIAFLIAAAGALGSGAAVITLRNPFRAAVALIATLISVAVIFLLAAAPFVAAIQVIVYAGAIVVLFLFVIAYLGDRPPALGEDPLGRYQAFAWLTVVVLGIQGFVAIVNTNLPRARNPLPEPTDIGDPESIGSAFVDTFPLSFEATSLVLLVAALGAVLLAKRAVLGEGGR